MKILLVLYIRDLTEDREFEIKLPMKKEELDKILDNSHEYIILDSDGIVKTDELDNIAELNKFLVDNNEKAKDIAILSTTYLSCEVKEMVEKNGYTIVDFEEETKGWASVYISDDDDKGLLLHHLGCMKFDFEKENPITEDMEDYIRWYALWNTAMCEGWRETEYKDKGYLVCRKK